ncbi:hypothetical protein [Limnobacter sp.]|uniref:hypothetical protein n=1 Tax=Limnobacter sp. TaxID=2003368 RepID=UPI0035141113
MNSSASPANANQGNLAATVVHIDDFDTTPGTPSSSTSRACCGIARGLKAPLMLAAAGTFQLALGIYNAVLKFRYETTPTEHAFYSAGAGIGITSGVIFWALAALCATGGFFSGRDNPQTQIAPRAASEPASVPATPQPQGSYTVVTQPNQEIALAVLSDSPRSDQMP